MKSDKYTCDNCGVEAKDHPYDEKGWLIVADGNVSLTHGRDKSRVAITGYLNTYARDYCFCSLKCFCEYMKRIMRNGKLRVRTHAK